MKVVSSLAVLCLVSATAVACTGSGSSQASLDQESQGQASSAATSTSVVVSPAERAQAIVDESGGAAAWEQSLVGDLDDAAAAAALGYLAAMGTVTVEGWLVDLTGSPLAADRLAFGLLQAGVAFERLGSDGNTLAGDDDFAEVLALLSDSISRADIGGVDVDAARVALGAAVEVGATTGGRLANPTAAGELALVTLADIVGLHVEIDVDDEDPGRRSVWLADEAGLLAVAELPVTCAQNLPVVGGSGCLRSSSEPVQLLGLGTEVGENWLAATTGALGPNPALEPTSVDGGVSWTNNEAQVYRPDNVSSGPDGVVLRAAPVEVASVLELPYTSGMLVSQDSFGYGTYSFEIVLPSDLGLWPAVWLLDAEACESPGRCAGYETQSYHEIDLLETSGRDPGVVYTSVHWWDEVIRSGSAMTAADLAGERHVVSLQRRPGLLIWELDGVEVGRVAGTMESDSGGNVIAGPHRDAPMRLIVNLAVGGSFAGDRLVGRHGQWWGDAMVPDSFPDVGWTAAEFVIHEATFTPLN